MAFPYPSPDSEGDRRKRNRRSEATSSDSSDAGEFDIFNVRFRVAAPPPPPLPMKSVWSKECSTIQQTLKPVSLEDEATRILDAENVQDVVSVELCLRMHCDLDTTEGHPTILIVARWVNDGCSYVWGRAVSRIKKFVDSTRVANGNLEGVDIAVEIVAEDLVLDKFIYPISALLMSRGMESDWPYIKERVARIMDSYPATKGHATSIHLFQLGFSPRWDENPTTVYVSVDYECLESKWPPVMGEIQQYLCRFKYVDLHLHFEHGVVEQCAFQLIPNCRTEKQTLARQRANNLVPKIPYHVKVNLGDDIGACNYIRADNGNLVPPLIGTLGCWLVIKTQNFPDGVRVALTNYHVIRPAYAGFKVHANAAGELRFDAPEKGSKLWEADEVGIKPRKDAAKIEHPTRAKHNQGVWVKNMHIKNQTGNIQAMKQNELNGMLAFFDRGEHVLGTVFCASGYKRRTRNNGRLDWALIMPLGPARIGENWLPPFETWEEKYTLEGDYYPAGETYNGSLQQPTERGLRGLAQTENIFKVGATTGASIGIFDSMKGGVKFPEDRHVMGDNINSEEFAYIQDGNLNDEYALRQAFVNKGDSGSVVWDREGHLAGLLFSGQAPHQAGKTLMYVTPIHDVFEDIKAFSQGNISDIRVAGVE